MKTTAYFREQVLRKRDYINPEWCQQVIDNPVAKEQQTDGRWRYWGYIPELTGKGIAGCHIGRWRNSAQRIS